MRLDDDGLLAELDLLTPAEAAVRAQVSVSTIYSWVADERVVAYRVGPRLLLEEDSVMDCDLALRRSQVGRPRHHANRSAALDDDGLHEQEGLLTLREAAEKARVSVEAVRLWVKRQQVYSIEWEGDVYVGSRSLYDCELARRETPQGRKRANKMLVLDRCTIQLSSGEFCDAPAAEGAPHPVCWRHLSKLTRWVWEMRSDHTTVHADRVVTNRGAAEGRPSWVYYALLPHGLVKIGYTADPLSRMRGLRVDDDALLALEPGDRALERRRLSQFRHLASRMTEEFRPAQELQDHVASVVDRHGSPSAILDFNSGSIVESG